MWVLTSPGSNTSRWTCRHRFGRPEQRSRRHAPPGSGRSAPAPAGAKSQSGNACGHLSRRSHGPRAKALVKVFHNLVIGLVFEILAGQSFLDVFRSIAGADLNFIVTATGTNHSGNDALPASVQFVLFFGGAGRLWLSRPKSGLLLRLHPIICS